MDGYTKRIFGIHKQGLSTPQAILKHLDLCQRRQWLAMRQEGRHFTSNS